MATLHSLSRRTDAFAYDQKVQPVESDGFTLIEILVGAVLLAIVAGMAGSLVMVSNRSLTQSEALANAGSAIDKNISEIRQIAERFTCCSGTCTSNPGASAKCTGSPGSSDYYYPDPTNTSDVTFFEESCANTNARSLVTPLKTEIDNTPAVSGVVLTSAIDDSAAHRISVTYSAGGSSRVFKVSPAVAAWCP